MSFNKQAFFDFKNELNLSKWLTSQKPGYCCNLKDGRESRSPLMV